LATPAQAVEQLARNLPNAAIFFLTYMGMFTFTPQIEEAEGANAMVVAIR
jgi:hypothetical protein